MPLVGFAPAIPANERPQIYAVDRAATGVDPVSTNESKFSLLNIYSDFLISLQNIDMSLADGLIYYH